LSSHNLPRVFESISLANPIMENLCYRHILARASS
jgi:hypothetical protein